jgi:hypothetical protein
MAQITEVIPEFQADEKPLLTDPANFSQYTDNYHVKLESVIPSINTWSTQVNTVRDEINTISTDIDSKAAEAIALKNATATATQVSSSTPASVVYDSVNNIFQFEIPQGFAGADGEDGANGLNGATGNGIQSVTQIGGDGSAGSTDTYRILFTNGTTYDFSVYNGANGLSGTGTGDLVASANLSDVLDRATSLNNLLPSQAGKDGYTLQSVSGQATWVEVETVPTTPTPVLSGATNADENTDVVITVSNYDTNADYTATLTAGTYVNNDDGTFTITLPDYDVATSVTFTLVANRVGENTSEQATFGITVNEVLIPVLDRPILTGSISGQENSLLVLTVSNYDANNTYTTTLDFGSVIDNENGTFSLTLPDYAATTTVQFQIYASRDGYQTSQTATQNISVTNTILADPIISGLNSGLEEATITLTVDNYNATQTYFPTVNFGSVVNNGNGTFDVTLPAFATSSSVTLSVYTTRAGDIDSQTVTYNITVEELNIVADSAVTFDLTTNELYNDGWSA